MDADGTLSYSQPREVIFIHGIHFDTLESFKKNISWCEKWQVVKKLPGKAWNHKL